MLIDTHSHLNFKAFNKDRDEVIKRSLENNVWLINASSTFDTSKLAIEIAEQYDKGVYASVGLHPIHVKDNDFHTAKYRSEAKASKKVVAIGETGLDYMYPEQEKQKQVFLQHLELAKELNLPVILHCRKAYDEMIEILQRATLCKNDRGLPSVTGVVHCFTGRWSQAKKYLDMGLHLGFNGIIFKHNVDEVIKKVPIDRILIETDCPYLTPPLPRRSSAGTKAGPKAKKERNEPMFVKYVAERIAELRNESYEKISEVTTQNAKRLFNLT